MKVTSLADARARRRRKLMFRVDLPPTLHRKLERAAAKQGSTPSAFFEKTLRTWMIRAERAERRAERVQRPRPRPARPITPTGPAPIPDTPA